MKLSQSDAVEIISKLQKGEGTDAQQEEWMDCIKNSFPFYEKIINLLFWSKLLATKYAPKWED